MKQMSVLGIPGHVVLAEPETVVGELGAALFATRLVAFCVVL